MPLETLILDQLQAKPQIKRWVIAYSGGLDSSVLLFLVVLANRQLPNPKPVIAVHINHQLSPNADTWQQHCEQQSKQLGVTFIGNKVLVENQGQGIEAAAREQRYQAFAEIMRADDCLLTGHHQDDQSETFLLRLMRGAGVQGLGAITEIRPFAQGQLLRPLLGVSRSELETYAKAQTLAWVDDESNEQVVFDRNFLRQDVLPLLSSRWQQVKSRLAQTAERLQAAQQLLDDLAAMDLQTLQPRVERYGNSIDLNCLKQLNTERINNLLRFWCAQQHLPQPDSQQLKEIHRQLLTQSNMLTQAVVTWGQSSLSCECRQYQQRLYIMKTLPSFDIPTDPVVWNIGETLTLKNAGVLSTILEKKAQHGTLGLLSKSMVEQKKCIVQWRSGGERCTPAGRDKSQQLKKLLQEYQLDTWLRDRVPLIYIDDELAAVGDLWVCADYAAKAGEEAYNINWVMSRQHLH